MENTTVAIFATIDNLYAVVAKNATTIRIFRMVEVVTICYRLNFNKICNITFIYYVCGVIK